MKYTKAKLEAFPAVRKTFFINSIGKVLPIIPSSMDEFVEKIDKTFRFLIAFTCSQKAAVVVMHFRKAHCGLYISKKRIL